MRWIIRVVTWGISTVFIPSRVGRLLDRENAQSSGRDATIPMEIPAQPAAQYVNCVQTTIGTTVSDSAAQQGNGLSSCHAAYILHVHARQGACSVLC